MVFPELNYESNGNVWMKFFKALQFLVKSTQKWLYLYSDEKLNVWLDSRNRFSYLCIIRLDT